MFSSRVTDEYCFSSNGSIRRTRPKRRVLLAAGNGPFVFLLRCRGPSASLWVGYDVVTKGSANMINCNYCNIIMFASSTVHPS